MFDCCLPVFIFVCFFSITSHCPIIFFFSFSLCLCWSFFLSTRQTFWLTGREFCSSWHRFAPVGVVLLWLALFCSSWCHFALVGIVLLWLASFCSGWHCFALVGVVLLQLASLLHQPICSPKRYVCLIVVYLFLFLYAFS